MPSIFVLAIWLVYWFEFRFNFFFNSFGVSPKSFKGLLGIFFSPFIHGSAKHLYSNTIPLFLLSMALYYFYNKFANKIILFGVLGSGFLTWILGQEGTYHIGANGRMYWCRWNNLFETRRSCDKRSDGKNFHWGNFQHPDLQSRSY